jgi:hypothetical protein
MSYLWIVCLIAAVVLVAFSIFLYPRNLAPRMSETDFADASSSLKTMRTIALMTVGFTLIWGYVLWRTTTPDQEALVVVASMAFIILGYGWTSRPYHALEKHASKDPIRSIARH